MEAKIEKIIDFSSSRVKYQTPIKFQVAVEREFGNFPTEEIIPRDEEEKIG